METHEDHVIMTMEEFDVLPPKGNADYISNSRSSGFACKVKEELKEKGEIITNWYYCTQRAVVMGYAPVSSKQIFIFECDWVRP